MQELDKIKRLWKTADDEFTAHESLDAKTVEQSIANRSIGITSKLLNSLRMGIVSLSVSLLLFGYNAYGYAGNELVVSLSISCLLLCAILLAFLVCQYKQLSSFDRGGLSLLDVLVGKIDYFKKSLPWVHHAIAMSIALLILALNLLTDNQAGRYAIGNIWLNIGFEIIAYACMIIILKFSHSIYLKQYGNALNDLEKTTLTEMDAQFRKHTWLRRAILIIALLVAAAGLVVFYLKANG
jgi:hypothetical protein